MQVLIAESRYHDAETKTTINHVLLSHLKVSRYIGERRGIESLGVRITYPN